MTYYLWQAILGRPPKLELSESEYKNIQTAWNGSLEILIMEEAWDCLIQNYIELEMELLHSALHSMILSQDTYDTIQDARLTFTRRLFNLLQACRAYLDHTPRHLRNIDKQGNIKQAFMALRNEIYDQNFSYRFMEALRNYAQHSGMPMHSATFSNSWVRGGEDSSEAPGSMRHTVAGTITLKWLKKDKAFKASILAELDATLEELDVSTLTREYIEALGDIHSELRTQIKPKLEEWKSIIRNAISKYADVNNGIVSGLCIAEFNSENIAIQKTNIFDSLLLRTEHLVRKNGNLTNLRLRYVSSEIIPAKKKLHN